MASIKQQILSGVFYTALARYSSILISLFVTAVLARLLSPDEFGIVAIATVIINFFNLFTNIGFSAAIIQNKELTQKDLSHIYSFTLWMGLGLSVLFFASSWSIARYYHNFQLIAICQLLAVSLFFSSAAIVPNTLFFRDKNFKFIAYRTFFIQVITGLLAISAALAGAGLYTLTIQPIVSSLLIYLVSLKKYPQQIHFTSGFQSIRKIWNYSMGQFLFNLVNYFTRNLDKLLIGKYMGMNPLGYYEKSYRLMMLPLQNITYVITPVMHPILSDYQNDKERLAQAHERIIRLLAFIGFPLSTLLYFGADELVLLFFGSQWAASIPVFRILSLTVCLQLILSSSGAFYQAGNDTRNLFICGVFSATTSTIGILAGIFYFGSLEAIAWCILIAFSLNFIQCYIQLYRYTLHRPIRLFYKKLSSPLGVGILSGGALYALSLYTIHWHLLVALSVKTICCLAITACYVQCTHEYDILGKIKQLKNK
ncbi:lipopolysaccharide biosynthesis protein [uncultured Bacteroides sp.]|uniref:lipopolysaccharide biosynthesis protein n=1 Tax=uncultured Bacteroides sp. TaxID=162156 RepID=UPI00261E5A3E|nr:lipopolysaccharide biosynthesis protein [uncultured Bacteroides sp.]